MPPINQIRQREYLLLIVETTSLVSWPDVATETLPIPLDLNLPQKDVGLEAI